MIKKNAGDTRPAKTIIVSKALSCSCSTVLKIDLITANSIGVSYTTLPENLPKSFGNFIGLWLLRETGFPWKEKPLEIQSCLSNNPNGSCVFNGLDLIANDYAVGFSVGPVLTGSGSQRNGNVAAYAIISVADHPCIEIKNTYLTVEFVKAGSIAVAYHFPDQMLPVDNNAWVGVWSSAGANLYTTPPDYANKIAFPGSKGITCVNQLTVARGISYTVCLFNSGMKNQGPPGLTAMSAYVKFTA